METRIWSEKKKGGMVVDVMGAWRKRVRIDRRMISTRIKRKIGAKKE